MTYVADVATSRKKQDASSPRLSFGELIHLAYRRARDKHGPARITYDAVAQRISQIVPISDSQIYRYEKLEEPPTSAGTRQHIYLLLLAYGAVPEDYGFKWEWEGFNMGQVRRLLKP